MRILKSFITAQFPKFNLSWSLVVFLPFFILKSNFASCQVEYQDSLRNVITTAASDKQKLNALILLGLERNSLHADSLQKYATESQQLAAALNNQGAFLESLLMQGAVWNKKGESSKAIELAEKEILKEYAIPDLRHKQRKFYLLKGFALNVINKPKQAQETFFAVLKQAEKEDDLFVQATALNGIGWSYQNLNKNSEAVEWYKKGISILYNTNLSNRLNRDMITVLQSNIGLACYALYNNSCNKKFADSANLYLDSSIYACRKDGFSGVLAISLGTKALLIHEAGGSNAEAESILQEAVNIRKKLGQLYFIITDMAKLSELYYQSGEYEKSIIVCRDAIRLADSSGVKSDIIYLYENLAKSFQANKQYKEHGEILALQIRIQDSINKANTASSLNELTIKYEVQKKESLIAKQEYYLLRRKILIYIIFFCAMAVLVTAFIKFWKFQKRQKNKLAAELKQARDMERERIIADLHDDVGATLSSMHIYGDLANTVWDTQPQQSKEMVGKISSQSKELMARMSDIVWSLKPAGEEKNTLIVRLKNYTQDLLAGKGITASFNIDEAIATAIVNPLARKNILLIAKEAINNIAKYSQARQAVFNLKKENENIQFIISDDGKGYDKANVKSGNGIGNIEQRCTQLNGSCDITTAPAKGVTITCTFPLTIISHSG